MPLPYTNSVAMPGMTGCLTPPLKGCDRSPMPTTNQPLIERIERRFNERFRQAPAHIARAPGRVNLLGEHVDYNDGFVMPAAIDRATYIAFSPAPDGVSRLIADDFQEEIALSPESVQARTQANGNALPEWGFYPAGVMHTLLEEGHAAPPMLAVFASDVPRGSGLSSSASVETAFLTAWQYLAGGSMPLMARALLCQRAENQYVGVRCGIMDQFASVCGEENRLLLLDCRSLAWQRIALPEEVAIVIGDTSVRRRLTGGEYNLRHSECEQAMEYLRAYLPGIHSLRDVSSRDLDRLAAGIPPVIERRARHVVKEIERTGQARVAIEAGDSVSFGRLMNDSHASLRDLYEVSSFELDSMVAIAQTLPGCLGARLTGAGFGGCTVNLVESARAEEFAAALMERYQAATGLTPEIYLTRPAKGANLVR